MRKKTENYHLLSTTWEGNERKNWESSMSQILYSENGKTIADNQKTD